MTAIIRAFHPTDATACHTVFVRAVREGAAPRYSDKELADWLPDATMPSGWGDWLARHLTFVAKEGESLVGFMMLERDGYLNMAFVLPERMGKGVSDALLFRIIEEARHLRLRRLTVLASRHAQGFFARHGWHHAPDLPPRPRQDPRQGPDENPVHRPMALTLPCTP